MAATTTPSISWLLPKLSSAYPEIEFQAGNVSAWNPEQRTVYYAPDDGWQVLHELGHALLDHRNYTRDIELIGLERDAWQRARTVANQLDLTIPDEAIQTHLDTYRDWLHARSTCPDCQQTGLQTDPKRYSCPHCQTTWRVNDARTCGLRRYKQK